MNLVEVMAEVGARLDTIPGLRVFPYPPDRIEPPAAIVDLPDTITYDETYVRGMDRMTIPVFVVVGKASDRKSIEQVSAYASGSDSIKTVLEAGIYTAFDTIRVMTADFDVVRIAGTDYWQVSFDVDVVGQGAS